MKLECRRKLSKNQSGYQYTAFSEKYIYPFSSNNLCNGTDISKKRSNCILNSVYIIRWLMMYTNIYKAIYILDKRIWEVFIHIHVHHWNAISTKSIIDVSNQRLTLSGKYLLYMFLSWTLWFPSKKKRKILFFAHFDKKTEILPLLTSYTVSKAKIK